VFNRVLVPQINPQRYHHASRSHHSTDRPPLQLSSYPTSHACHKIVAITIISISIASSSQSHHHKCLNRSAIFFTIFINIIIVVAIVMIKPTVIFASMICIRFSFFTVLFLDLEVQQNICSYFLVYFIVIRNCLTIIL
jgi:hypothetical protein